MGKLKKVSKFLTVLLVICLGITYYFIAQHNVVGKEAKINNSVVFDDVIIELDTKGRVGQHGISSCRIRTSTS